MSAAEVETLAFKIEAAGFDGLPERVLAALVDGRFKLETETETVRSENGFAVLRVVARRIVIDLDEPTPTPGSARDVAEKLAGIV